MIANASPVQSEAFGEADAGFEYFASLAHYQSIANRILAALAGGGRFVLLTGDPPANGRLLSNTLSKAAGGTHTVIGVPCGQNLVRDDWRRLVPGPASEADLPESSAAALLVALGTPLPLYVLEDADQLSDEQLQEFFSTWLFGEPTIGTAVLAVTRAFLARLERPALSFLIEGLAARLQFQHLGPDEIGTFIRQQLPSDDAERAFSSDTIAAITAASGGDPTLVNRLASRALDSHRGNVSMRPAPIAAPRAPVAPPTPVPTPAAPKAETTPATAPEANAAPPPAPAQAQPSPADEPPAATAPAKPRHSVGRRLAIGSIFALAYFAILLLLGSYIPKYFRPASEAPETAAPPSPPAPQARPALDAASPSPPAEAPPVDAVPAPPDDNRSDAAPPLPLATGAGAELAPEAARPAMQEPPTATRGNEAQSSVQAVPEPGAAGDAASAAQEAAAPATDLSASPSASPATPLAPATIAVPTSQPVAVSPEIAALVARGDALLSSGDIISARLYYERAANAGDGHAATRMGETFDPDFLALAGVRGVRGDAATAAAWYNRARELGDSNAPRQSETLRTKQ